MSINPTAWKLRTHDGYQLSKPVQRRMTHSLFVDDLKIYAKSKEKLTKVLSDTKSEMMDAGLVWREVKCAVLHLTRGKVVDKDGDIRLDEEITLKCLENQPYKFLGMPETDIHNTDKLIQLLIENISQRTNVIWTSPLSDFNKVLATNSFAMSLVNYFMWSQRINITDLRKIDAAVRSIINDVYAKHKNQMNSILYRGLGLFSVEIICKETKLKSLAKIITSRDPRIRLVREFENEQYNKGRCSIFKDAIKFANDLGVTVDYGPDSFCLKYKDARDKTYETSDVKYMKNILLKARNEGLKREISSSTWQGVMFKTRWNDGHLETNCFSCVTSWKTCPVQFISEVQGLYCQLLPTKSYQLIRSVSNDQNTVCHMCKRGQESVKHVLSNCESLAKYDFILRHDSAFKCIVFPILTQYKLIDQCPTWYSPSKVKPYYENEIAEFWWDTPKYQGNEEEDDTKLFRPDAKLRLKQERQIFILEMAVPWINNREI